MTQRPQSARLHRHVPVRIPKLIAGLALVLLLGGCAEALAMVPARLEPVANAPQTSAAALLPTLTPKPGAAPPPLALPPPAIAPPTVAPPVRPDALPVTPIPLAGPLAWRTAELSGLAWYGDTLILLPQYPTFTQDGQSAVYALPKAEILAFLNGEVAGPLRPQPVAWYDWGVAEALPGFEGYEAIAFDGDRVYVTSEVNNGFETAAYLIGGYANPDDSSIWLDAAAITYIPPQAALSNRSDESLLVAPDGTLLTLYEVNGAAWNAAPVAHRFDQFLQPLQPVPFPTIEYRITDATALDADGRFWAINYFFPSDTELAPAADPLAQEHESGATLPGQTQVERLVEFRFDGAQIVRTERAPLPLRLTLFSRNWEGIARLDEAGGFLLATDQFPETLLAFVAANEQP